MGKIGKKLLVICGPTATGKTKLALHLSKLFNGELISCDSRQVYKGLDIGTGKDKPLDTIIWGYDLVDANGDFSVSDYQKFARDKINEIWNLGKLPILVGGTGLYIKAVIDGIDTAAIPQNIEYRSLLEDKQTSELFELLLSKNRSKALSLNDSDKKNKRRLIRALEIEESGIIPQKETFECDDLIIGLKIDKEVLKQKIKTRIEERLILGFKNEVKKLLENGIGWQFQSMSSTGYRQYKDYLDKKIDFEKFKENWLLAETKYSKRQLTWFKKDKRVNWFDISDKQIFENVEHFVKKWYYNS